MTTTKFKFPYPCLFTEHDLDLVRRWETAKLPVSDEEVNRSAILYAVGDYLAMLRRRESEFHAQDRHEQIKDEHAEEAARCD